MKRMVFYVPQNKIKEFVQVVDANKLDARLKGMNDKDDLRIEVCYEKQERGAMFDLMELTDEMENDD